MPDGLGMDGRSASQGALPVLQAQQLARVV
jgi:hypothetical protein